jgi:hypothetical protein
MKEKQSLQIALNIIYSSEKRPTSAPRASLLSFGGLRIL